MSTGRPDAISVQDRLALYVVTDPGLAGPRGVVAVAREAAAGGAGVVQVRDKGASSQALAVTGRRVREALGTPGCGSRALVVVDDDVSAATAVDGVHLGARDAPPERARAVLGDDALVGLSVSTVAEVEALLLRQARHDGPLVDYLGVGPVWPTATKTDGAPPLGPDGLARVCAVSPLPVVAIGGVDAARAVEAVEAGATGVAVVSAVVAAADPAAAAAELRAAVEGAR